MSFTIAALSKNKTNPAYIGARYGVDRVVRAWGGETVHLIPDEPDDVEQQKELIYKALDLKPAAILLAPTHPTRLNAAIDAVVAAEIPLVYFVGQTEPSPAITFISADNEALGYAMAERMAEHLGGKGVVAIVDGHPNAVTTAPRSDGVIRALSNFPSIEIVSQCRGDYQRDIAYQVFKEELAKLPELDGVIVANDFMAFGVLEALKEANRQAAVIAANATPQGIAAIKQGDLIASVTFDAMSMAALAAEAALRILQGEQVPKQIMLPVALIDRSNLAMWDRDYTERTKVPWEIALAQQHKIDNTFIRP